ncbi:hypothetical protein TSUD_241680 [Trifolium subterraneum]|uniref:CCHC-type domain-containing protein n=1 Tax=Trifolium subterraneum TaxID=3900 RepID=A0A2Z6PR16_TRISU|nr:hypothetical protein TSUD_241680 [Trifolium subterraneum]
MDKNAKFISEGGSSNTPPLFDGDNYYYWKDKMELFLRSQDNNMEEYDRIMECKTAKEIWETLQTHHEGTNSVKETRIDIGVRKFELFEMKEEETIDQMYGRFTRFINELNSLGKSYTTHERIRKILRCLPKTWRSIVTAITVAKDLTKVSLEDLIGSLKAHESVLQEDKPKRKMIALETQSRECSQKDETLCEDEESLQEDDEEELAFLSRRIQRLMTRRNQLKKNFQPKRNGAKPEVDLSKIQCYGCNQFGHYKNDCPKNKQKKPFFKKKSMMATWDDLEEAQSEDEEQEANVCLMTHSNAEEDGHLEALCFKKKARKQVFYRTPEHSQNGLRNRNFRKPVYRHSLNTLRRDVYKRTPYKRSSYSQRIPYKKFETNTQGPKKWNNFLSFETREGGSVTFGNNEKASIKAICTIDELPPESCVVSLEKDKWIWHKRAGHVSMKTMSKLSKLNLVRDNLGKFDSKSDKGIFLGYSLTSKAYRIYNSRTQTLEESMHVKFDEFEDQPTVHTADDEEEEPVIVQNHDSDENPTPQGPPKTWRIVGYHPPDQIIAIVDESWIEAMKEELHQFEKNEVWNLQLEDGIFISQEKYVNDLLKKYKMNEAKIMSTPMHPSTSLDKDEKGKDVSEKEYRGMIGSLLYLTASRPDIVFAVGLCARFQTSPKESHLIAVKRIFRYLVGTPDVGLWYKKGSHFDLQAYCDADYAGDKIERKSTSGACQFLGEALVSWCCRKQNTIALSTTEAEYVAASNCCSQVIWIKNQLEDFSLSKVPRTKNPSTSSSPPRSPSPPKPPTPKSSSSSSYETSSESYKSIQEQNEEDSPSPTATIPSPKDSPPVLVKMKKSKSFDSSKIRRSSRIMSGAGKKPVVDTTVHVLDKSDSEIDLLEKEIDDFELEPVTSTKSELVKPKKSPTPKKNEVKIAVKAPRTKKKIAVKKKSKEKLLPTPLIQPEDEEIFQKYWMTKPVAETVYPLLVQAFYFNTQVFPDKDMITSNIKDVELVVDPYVIGSLIGIKSEGLEVYGNDWYDQVKISKEELKKKMFTEEGAKKNAPPSSMLKTEYKLVHNMCQHSFFPRTGSKDKKIALPYVMLLTRVFRLYYADMDNTISENHYYTFSLKNVHHMKKDVETPAVDVGSKIKRDVFEKTNLNVLADASGDHLENDLQTGEQTQISGDVDPTTESDKLVTTTATTLQGFKPVSAPQNTTMFSPLMTSSQRSLSSFCTSEFIRNILTSDTPEISTIPIPKPTDSTLPSIPSSFATFDSFCSSVNVTNAGTQQLVFEGNVNFDFPGPSRPTKRFRLETDMEQMRKDLDIVIKGMVVQHSMMDHLILESKTLRTWFTTVVCPQLHIPPPPEIETPQFDTFPTQNEKFDDDEDPTTSPAPDGANE